MAVYLRLQPLNTIYVLQAANLPDGILPSAINMTDQRRLIPEVDIPTEVQLSPLLYRYTTNPEIQPSTIPLLGV